MNSNIPIILFSVYSIGFLIIFIITNNFLGIVIIVMFSVFGLFINEQFNEIENMLRKHGGN